MLFKRTAGKKRSQHEIYMLMLYANNPEIVNRFTDDQRKWLIEFAKQQEIDSCLCCPYFAWKFSEDKKVSGCICTIGGKPEVNRKGKCPE
jgi:hypothetical protein